jgi:hypothetical protein
METETKDRLEKIPGIVTVSLWMLLAFMLYGAIIGSGFTFLILWMVFKHGR